MPLPSRTARRLLAVAWLALLASAAVAQEGLGDSRDELRQTFLAALNEARGKQGLPPVRLSAALSRAAQAQVDDMAARQYYDLKSPDGRTIESWLKEAKYREQLVTEKLVRTDRSPRSLAASWGVSPEAHRASLFHPEVEEVGVGAVDYQGLPLYAFVLARSEESYLSEYTRHLFARQEARFRDLDALREEMLGLVNQARAERKLDPLTRDAALDRAAQGYAEEIFQALKAGRPLPSSRELERRVKAEGYPIRRGIGESVVQGALAPEETLAALLGGKDQRSNILGGWFTQLGLGLAFERTPKGFFVVWVQCMSRPAGKERALTPGPSPVPSRPPSPGEGNREGKPPV
jgi:uncharacterized protein YkwD